jgi:hypothetical protein
MRSKANVSQAMDDHRRPKGGLAMPLFLFRQAVADELKPEVPPATLKGKQREPRWLPFLLPLSRTKDAQRQCLGFRV